MEETRQERQAPDTAELMGRIEELTAEAARSRMENRALLMAPELGVEIKAVPYLMKMADLSGVSDDEGLRAALGEVLEALPRLRTAPERAQGGFRVGAGLEDAGAAADELRLRAAFGL